MEPASLSWMVCIVRIAYFDPSNHIANPQATPIVDPPVVQPTAPVAPPPATETSTSDGNITAIISLVACFIASVIAITFVWYVNGVRYSSFVAINLAHLNKFQLVSCYLETRCRSFVMIEKQSSQTNDMILINWSRRHIRTIQQHIEIISFLSQSKYCAVYISPVP